jgi:hypothetical protein
MENQTKRDVERGLLLKLRESVNEQEELDWVQAELARLEADEPAGTISEHIINAVDDAVGFLAERCDLLAVQVEIEPALWKVVCLDGEFDALFAEAELMDFARNERHRRATPNGELAAERAAEAIRLIAQSGGGAL